MRRKTLSNAKLVVTVESNKCTREIRTISIYDNRIQEYLTAAYIQERGVGSFLNLGDMKETLNWKLNGDSRKYQFRWGQTVKNVTEGRAYIFD